MLPQSLLPWKQEKHKTPCCKDGSNSRIISDLDFAFNKCTNATHLELKINAFIVRHSGSRRHGRKLRYNPGSAETVRVLSGNVVRMA